MSNLPEYDEVHVISDIHMGVPQGFQILKETTRLANFIRWVGAQRPGERVALILNGDVRVIRKKKCAHYRQPHLPVGQFCLYTRSS